MHGLDGTLVNHHSLLLCRFVELIFSQGLLFTLTKILIFINQSIGYLLLCLFLPSKITVLSCLSSVVLSHRKKKSPRSECSACRDCND